MAIDISRLTENDIPGAVNVIQEAFKDDPYNLWVFNDRSKFNLTRNSVSLGIRCRWGLRNGLFYVAKDSEDGRVLGVAMWLPPRSSGAKESWAAWIDSWTMWFSQIGMNLWYGRGGLNVKRYYIWKDQQAEAQHEIWTDPQGYYFLNIMVVHPNAQGIGIGKILAKQVTNIADREGIKCYLESSRDIPNMKIYEAMGFHFVKKMVCEDQGETCDLYCMVREPRPTVDGS